MECGKEKFDLKGAKTALNECLSMHKKWRRECRYYLCECGSYHLTSEIEHSEKVYLKEEDLIFCDKWKELQKEKGA